jgi:parkin
MLELFSFGRKKISNKLPIFIKTNTGQQLSINLDPEWKIQNVKQLISSEIGINVDEVRKSFKKCTF